MLTRIYGTAFPTAEELEAHVKMREEAKLRDHRKIGREQKLYFIDEVVGKGLVMWLPNGTALRNTVEGLAVEMERRAGYIRVTTPHLAKEELYLTSGHLPYYKDGMYPPMVMDDGTYYLKAMNCPHHHRVYLHEPHSYRELPIRMAEYGTVYRNELSGTLQGLLRVRGLAMNDAHIYCRDQSRTKAVMDLTRRSFEIFGLKDYWFRLKWSPAQREVHRRAGDQGTPRPYCAGATGGGRAVCGGGQRGGVLRAKGGCAIQIGDWSRGDHVHHPT